MGLKVKKTRKFGRGVFTDALIKKGAWIETSPLIVLSQKDANTIDKTDLHRYAYSFKRTSAIALGLGSLFNHSERPNVSWKVLEKDNSVIFWAEEDIPAGSQLFINYGYDPAKEH